MANEKDWFIRERSEALAALLLTSRSDVRIRDEQESDDGVDLLVELREEDKPFSTQLFLVQVKGTLLEDEKRRTDLVKPLFESTSFHLPACVFVVNVRDNSAAYAWLAEPKIEKQGPKLEPSRAQLLPLDREAVDQIVTRIESWYKAFPRSSAAQAV